LNDERLKLDDSDTGLLTGIGNRRHTTNSNFIAKQR
jgi:hypothetical protein